MDEALRLKKDVRRKYYDEDDDEDEEEMLNEEEEEDIEEDMDEEEEGYESKMEKVTTILAVVAALLIGCIVLFLVGKTLGILPFEGLGFQKEEDAAQEDAGKVEMPKVVGRQVEEVKTELLGLGLTPEITYKETDE